MITINKFDLTEILSEYQLEDIFSAFSPTSLAIIPLMYQTGYLTIKEVKQPANNSMIDVQILYKLGFPNIEVEQSFYRRLLANINNENRIGDSLFLKLRLAVVGGKVELPAQWQTYNHNRRKLQL